MTARVRRFSDEAAMTEAALDFVAEAARQAVAERGRFLLALSGGTTPLPLYAAMARQGLCAPWDRVVFCFGDERLVPMGDPRSNFGAVAPLLFTRAPIPVGNIHPLPVEVRPPARAADVAAEELREVFGLAAGQIPRFDCLLLGLGPDGHMASLFPNSPALAERERLVADVAAPDTVEPKVPRLTMTLPVINAARNVLFLVSAKGKEQALAGALSGPPDPALPASLARPEGGAWWLVREEG